MDLPVHNQLLVVTEDQFENIRKTYNLTRESLQADVGSILIWYSQQPHLPSIKLDPGWVERILILNKCSMERTKKRLDMIFTSRNFMEFFQNRDPVRCFEMCGSTIKVIPLPRLMPDNTRLIMIKVVNTSEQFDCLEFLKAVYMIGEYRQHHDYSVGDRYISDMTGQNMGYLVKFNLGLLMKTQIANKEVFGNRLAGVHMLYPTGILDKTVSLMKMFMSKKLSERIFVHEDLPSLHAVIPKEILPKDYGGDEASTEEIYDKWRDVMTSPEQVKWIKTQDGLKSDESKRIGDTVADEMLGISGSFRKLVVD